MIFKKILTGAAIVTSFSLAAYKLEYIPLAATVIPEAIRQLGIPEETEDDKDTKDKDKESKPKDKK